MYLKENSKELLNENILKCCWKTYEFLELPSSRRVAAVVVNMFCWKFRRRVASRRRRRRNSFISFLILSYSNFLC